MADLEKILDRALGARDESELFDFKSEFSDSTACWVGVVKDIAAFANCGGGVILFGLANDGTPSDADISTLVEMDTARISDKFKKYTGTHVRHIEKRLVRKDKRDVVALLIPGADYPIPFVKPGTYPAPEKKQKQGIQQLTEFAQGTVYFRHGSKSEPAEAADFLNFVQQKVEEHRKSWSEGIRRVIEAPKGKTAVVSYSDEPQSPEADAATTTPKYFRSDPDKTHPYAPSEFLKEFHKQMPNNAISNYDILAVKYRHNLNDREDFVFQIHLSSPRYSEQFLDWLIGCYRADSDFFHEARRAYREFLQNK